MMKEFSKIILVLDYLILIVLFICTILFAEVDLTTITVAWIAQIGVSTGFYFWKARMENKVKIPIYVLKSLPKEFRSEMDLTQIVTTIIQSD